MQRSIAILSTLDFRCLPPTDTCPALRGSEPKQCETERRKVEQSFQSNHTFPRELRSVRRLNSCGGFAFCTDEESLAAFESFNHQNQSLHSRRNCCFSSPLCRSWLNNGYLIFSRRNLKSGRAEFQVPQVQPQKIQKEKKKKIKDSDMLAMSSKVMK